MRNRPSRRRYNDGTCRYLSQNLCLGFLTEEILFPGQFAGFPSNQSRRRYRVQFGKAGIRVSSQPRSNWFSMDEYFALERASDRRFEYREGEIVCMSGGSREHAA